MKLLACGACGNEEPEESRFCGNCGAPLVAADQPALQVEAGDGAMSTCGACGNQEPEGARFCGNCGSALAHSTALPAADQQAPAPTVEQPSPIEASEAHSRRRKRAAPWVVAGAVVVLLAAGGAIAALLVRSDGGSSREATPTATTAEPGATAVLPPSSGPTLAESLAPSFQVLTASQGALDDRVRALRAGVESFAALHVAAASLAASVMQAERVVDGLTPDEAADAEALTLLRRALAAHLAYAEALSSFPRLPRSLTDEQARAAVARAEDAQLAYAKVGFADPSLPGVFVSTAGNPRLLAVVPTPKPAPSSPVRRTIDLVPLLVGIGPDDPLTEGRCFGAYTARASLRVSGVVHHGGFVQCGDDANGDPSRASGVYRFSGPALPAGARLARVTAQAAIDESSSPAQRGSAVTWTAFYDGTPLCSVTVVWSASSPSPRALDCVFAPSQSSPRFDLRRLRIRQVASLASSGSLWAGLLHPAIVVEFPG